MSAPKEFRINNYITLKLEGVRTNIYIKGEIFRYCKGLFILNPETKSTLEITSIDEIADRFDGVWEEEDFELEDIPLSPKEMFLGHCSNLQAWVEHDYDTRILRSNLAFPLLKKLSDEGVPRAHIKLQEQILKRFQCGYFSVVIYLIEEKYHKLLEKEAIDTLMDSSRNFIKLIVNNYFEHPYYGWKASYNPLDHVLEVLRKLSPEKYDQKIRKIFEQEDFLTMYQLLPSYHIISALISILADPKINLLQKIVNLIEFSKKKNSELKEKNVWGEIDLSFRYFRQKDSFEDAMMQEVERNIKEDNQEVLKLCSHLNIIKIDSWPPSVWNR